MGLLFSRQNPRVEEPDATSNNAYRYPNKQGNFFASHFIMGGEKFETTQPEAYLFGENMDLNFLGQKPTPFPYAAPQPNEPTRTLRSLINIRKESLRFVKVSDTKEVERPQVSENTPSTTNYNIEFTFDSDVKCGITIYYFCTEDVTANGVIYTSEDPTMNSELYHYKKGVNQQFSHPSHILDPSKYPEEKLFYKFEDEIIPVLIQCVAEEGDEPKQSHMTFAIVEKNIDNSFTLKPLKQKLFVDGLCYLLQEIYGIENKNVYESKDATEEDVEDRGSECVICMSEARGTLILPCRHLCLCSSCAESLRYQANNCPICRAPFRALLQIRAVRKSNNTLPSVSQNGDNPAAQDIPPGYELISLIEALNGSTQSTAPPFVPPPIPSFANSPDTRQKHRYLDKNHSSSTPKLGGSNSKKEDSSTKKSQGNVDGSSIPEVVIASIMSSDKVTFKTESLSLTRGEGRKHRKSFRTSSAPEKMRLLTNSMELVNELGGSKRKVEKGGDLAETRSLLESNSAAEECSASISLPKSSWSCSRGSPISLSTPHSLHLWEKSGKDISPAGEDSDYYTPEDPSTTILVDQSTDTGLDTPLDIEPGKLNDSIGKAKGDHCMSGKLKNHSEMIVLNVGDAETSFITTPDRIKRVSDSLETPPKNTSESSMSSNGNSPEKSETTKLLNSASSSNHTGDTGFSSKSSNQTSIQPPNQDAVPE